MITRAYFDIPGGFCAVVKLMSPPCKGSGAAGGGCSRAAGSLKSVDADGFQKSGGKGGGSDAPGAPPVQDKQRKTCKRICTFMFKGGVYKTSTAIHAAAALAGIQCRYFLDRTPTFRVDD